MHDTVLSFVDRVVKSEDVRDKRVLEVGSYNVNGTVRPLITRYEPESYLGIDMRPGPDVDFVCDITDPELDSDDADQYDLVISAEMLEHVLDWRKAVNNMKRLVAPGGMLVLTTRSFGFPLHEYPSDYWRFEVEDMQRIFGDMEVEIERDTLVAGVFVKARKPYGMNPIDLSHITVRSMEQ